MPCQVPVCAFQGETESVGAVTVTPAAPPRQNTVLAAAPEQACGFEVRELPLVTAPVGEPGCERGLGVAAMHA